MKVPSSSFAYLMAVLLLSAQPAIRAQDGPSPLYDKSYALVIGISNYQHQDKWKQIPNASNDARSVADLLINTGFQVKTLYNHQATKEAIENAFVGQDGLSNKLGKNDRVLVFFAGHGHTIVAGGKDRGYIVPWDADSPDRVMKLIDMDDLKKFSRYMDNAKHQLFILDSCYGGTLGREDLTRAASREMPSGIRPPTYLRDVTQPRARQILTAGGKDQEVVDGRGLFPDHSLFTGWLLAALRGEGGGELGSDGYITFSDLAAFLEKKASNERQTPHIDTLEEHIAGREFVFISPVAHRRTVIPPAFEPADAAAEPMRLLESIGPQGLKMELQEQMDRARVSNVEFRIGSVGRELRSVSASMLSDVPQNYDYKMDVSYRVLDARRALVQVRFRKSSSALPDLSPVEQEISIEDMRFEQLAQKILARFRPSADFHLHLTLLPCANCPADLQQQVHHRLSAWGMDVQIPRIKFVKDEDKSPAADLQVFVSSFVSSDSGHDVFGASIYVHHATKGNKTFISRKVDPASWAAALQELEDQVRSYLADVVTQY